jgi:hypothetical protein
LLADYFLVFFEYFVRVDLSVFEALWNKLWRFW